MRSVFYRILSRVSLFWRYFFLLVLVVGLYLAALTLSNRQSAQALQEAYLEQTQESFRANTERFAGLLERCAGLPEVIRRSRYYTDASVVRSPLQPRDNMALSFLREDLRSQGRLLDLPEECFVYFQRAGACVTQERYYSRAQDCFEDYLVYDGPDLVDHMDRELDSRAVSGMRTLLPAAQVAVGGAAARSTLTLLVQETQVAQVYGFLLPVESVLDYFHIRSLPEETSLEITGANGTAILSYNARTQADLIRFTAAVSGVSAAVTIGIPRSYFQQATQNAQSGAHLLFLACAVLGMALCILFSHVTAKPLRRLVRQLPGRADDLSDINELLVIDHYLKSEQKKKEELHDMLLSSVLVRVFSGLPVREGEYASLSAAYPLLQQPLQLAVALDRDPCTTDECVMVGLLRQRLPEGFLCEYINARQAVVLFPAEFSAYGQLQQALTELNGAQPPRFVCGVSEAFIGLEEMSSALRQAQLCVPEDGRCAVLPFVEEMVSGRACVAGPGFDLRRFQHELDCWNRNELLQQLDSLVDRAARESLSRPEGVFHSILFLLEGAAHAVGLSFTPCPYRAGQTPADNLRRLKAVVDDLFRQKSQLPLSDRQQLCDDVVSYVRAHFSDDNLSLFALSREFDLSERFVHNAIMSTCGMNFSSLLTQVRMQEAARLLRGTTLSVHEVAVRCGFTADSTFYRSFKKYYRITPTEYRESPNPPAGRQE